MEKINKEELMKKLNLSEEDLTKVAGGESSDNCILQCNVLFFNCKRACRGCDYDACMGRCYDWTNTCLENCH